MKSFKGFFYFLVSLKFLFMIFLILLGGIGLGPDEAQYWTWSRQLDFGYYSKPPAIAWQIYLGTWLFGSTELGVRFGALLLGTFLSLAIYRLAEKSQLSPRASFYAGLLAVFTPFGFYGTFFAITDTGMLLFWTLALTALAEAIGTKTPPNYSLIGLSVGFGALFKWSIYLFWPVALLALLLYPFLRNRGLVAGFFISLLGLIPTVYWNISHDFVTFKHVFTIVKGGNNGGASGNPLEFIGSQVAILSPLVFILLIGSWIRIKKDNSVYFLGFSSLILLGIFLAYSFLKKGQGNWCLFAYPGAFVFLASQWEDRRRWLSAAICLSLVLSLFSFLIPSLQEKGLVPWKMSPFRHNVGLANLEAWLKNHPKALLVSDKYQTVSQASFYNPEQSQAFFLNLQGSRKNQFTFWPLSQQDYNQSFYFIFIDNDPQLEDKVTFAKSSYAEVLPKYFTEVKEPIEIPLFSSSLGVVKKALIFPLFGFRGEYPLDPDKY